MEESEKGIKLATCRKLPFFLIYLECGHSTHSLKMLPLMGEVEESSKGAAAWAAKGNGIVHLESDLCAANKFTQHFGPN